MSSLRCSSSLTNCNILSSTLIRANLFLNIFNREAKNWELIIYVKNYVGDLFQILRETAPVRPPVQRTNILEDEAIVLQGGNPLETGGLFSWVKGSSTSVVDKLHVVLKNIAKNTFKNKYSAKIF